MIIANAEARISNADALLRGLKFDRLNLRMSDELKNRTKKFALDVIGLCSGLPHTLETRHAIGQVTRVR